MAGSQLPGFAGAPIADLALYTFDGNSWEAIPFQIDEFDASGKLVSFEDGLLDDNDELVLMAFDAGISANLSQWPLDVKARQHIRYAIKVTDPLNPNEEVWVYLFRSTTLSHATESYVTWDPDTQTAHALDYTAVFSDTMVGMSRLRLFGSVDVLDRQKVRVDTDYPLLPTITEETLANLLQSLEIPVDIPLAVHGPVRAASANQDVGWSYVFYNAQFALNVALPLQDIDDFLGSRIHFESVRTSFDWRDPATTGMSPAFYYDANTPVGVLIDGNLDTVPVAPMGDWFQVSGAAGSLLTVYDLNPGAGIAEAYYRDDQAYHSSDTGDGQLFGDAGISVVAANSDTSIGLIRLNQSFYILPAQAANQGSAYLERWQNPLEATAYIQGYVPPALDFHTYLPVFAHQ